MEQNKTHNSQPTQPRTLSKLFIMESKSPSHEMAVASKDTVENINDDGKKLNTPPASSAELCGSESSTSVGRGFGNPSAGFGAGLQNVPSPITTTTTTQRQAPPREVIKANDVREPLPVTNLPGITEALGDLAPSQANQPPVKLPGRPAPIAENVSVVPPSEPELLYGDSQEDSPNKKDAAPLLNIYSRRADQIGPSHRIPGIGHLGDLLAPPGWKTGDEPIDEAEAQKLFAASRLKAKELLDEDITVTGQLSSADQEKRSAEKNAQYQIQRALDEYLLIERVKLHKFWQERKQKLSQQLHSQPQQHRQSEARPQPMQPPAETSMIAYQRQQQFLVPASPHLYGPSPPVSGGTLNARIHFMQQGSTDVPLDHEWLRADKVLLPGLHIPQASPMSPTFLDPGLVPQTLEAVYHCYARNQVIIMNMNNENERFLTQWTAKFHGQRPQDPAAMPGVIPLITGRQAAPLGSIHHGYVPQESHPRPPSQAKYEGIPELAAQTHQARPIPFVLNRSNLRQEYGKALSHPANRDGPFRYPGGDRDSAERKTQGANIPEPKKRGRTPRSDKKKTWYADDIAEANLPTSIISQAAMKAGMDFMTNEDRKQTPPKPKGRRGMPIIDPKKGFAVSADAAKALIAKGAADARPRQRQNSVALKTSTNPSVAVVAPSTGVVAGYQTAFYPTAEIQVNDVLQLQRDEDTISAPNSGVSGPSSDTPDDPKDSNYGQKAQRKPATPRAAAPRKTAPTAGKKRKSTEAATPAKKRTRHLVDGTADKEY
ncbi:MAG: hypothetical protein ASARMPREDX12_003450 [Alectoria sarmentosa]|nr:MAG: hypothetical protein ASARMPREDX12_003450 [Alectoria sarmentosa]